MLNFLQSKNEPRKDYWGSKELSGAHQGSKALKYTFRAKISRKLLGLIRAFRRSSELSGAQKWLKHSNPQSFGSQGGSLRIKKKELTRAHMGLNLKNSNPYITFLLNLLKFIKIFLKQEILLKLQLLSCSQYYTFSL